MLSAADANTVSAIRQNLWASAGRAQAAGLETLYTHMVAVATALLNGTPTPTAKPVTTAAQFQQISNDYFAVLAAPNTNTPTGVPTGYSPGTDLLNWFGDNVPFAQQIGNSVYNGGAGPTNPFAGFVTTLEEVAIGGAVLIGVLLIYSAVKK